MNTCLAQVCHVSVPESWLGHVSITTTSEYIEIDMAMKRKAIERCPPNAREMSGFGLCPGLLVGRSL